MKDINVEVTIAAEPADIWPLLADVTTWPQWAGFDSAMVESGDGVGEIRQLHRGSYVTRERVTVLDPERRLVYEVISGVPVRGYAAEVTLTPSDTGTTLRWHSTFEPKWPGTGGIIQRRLGAFIEETARGLAREAEARSARADRQREEAAS